jgi:hypothetical protein
MIMGGDMKILQDNEKLFLSEFNKKFRDAENEADQKSWDTDFRQEWEVAKETSEYKRALDIQQRSRIARTKETPKHGVVVFGKRGNECVFKFAEAGSGKDKLFTLLPEGALPLFKTDKSEAAGKTSDTFDDLFKYVTDNLFADRAYAPQRISRDAMNRINAWKNNNGNVSMEKYLKLLMRAVELGALPSNSVITSTKTCKELREAISLSYLEKISDVADRLDENKENIILAEELKK